MPLVRSADRSCPPRHQHDSRGAEPGGGQQTCRSNEASPCRGTRRTDPSEPARSTRRSGPGRRAPSPKPGLPLSQARAGWNASRWPTTQGHHLQRIAARRSGRHARGERGSGGRAGRRSGCPNPAGANRATIVCANGVGSLEPGERAGLVGGDLIGGGHHHEESDGHPDDGQQQPQPDPPRQAMVAGSIGCFWSFPHAQFYSELARLAGAGYLDEESEEGGPRRRFAITPRGRDALGAGWPSPRRGRPRSATRDF